MAYDNPVVPFGGGDMTVAYRLANTGNVIVTGTARIQVKGPLGVRVANSGQIEIPELLPDSEWLVLAGLALLLLLLFLWWLRRWRARRYAALPGFDDLGPATVTVPAAAGTAKASGMMLVALAATALAAPAPPPAPLPDPGAVELRVSIAPARSPEPTASPTLSPTGSPTSPAPSPPPGELPRTGVAIGVTLMAGAALVGGGTGVPLLVGRRRGHQDLRVGDGIRRV